MYSYSELVCKTLGEEHKMVKERGMQGMYKKQLLTDNPKPLGLNPAKKRKRERTHRIWNLKWCPRSERQVLASLQKNRRRWHGGYWRPSGIDSTHWRMLLEERWMIVVNTPELRPFDEWWIVRRRIRVVHYRLKEHCRVSSRSIRHRSSKSSITRQHNSVEYKYQIIEIIYILKYQGK